MFVNERIFPRPTWLILTFIKLILKEIQLLIPRQFLNFILTLVRIRLILAKLCKKKFSKTLPINTLASFSLCMRFHPSINIICHTSIKRAISTFKNINKPFLFHNKTKNKNYLNQTSLK